jgi:hypothetical protein
VGKFAPEEKSYLPISKLQRLSQGGLRCPWWKHGWVLGGASVLFKKWMSNLKNGLRSSTLRVNARHNDPNLPSSGHTYLSALTIGTQRTVHTSAQRPVAKTMLLQWQQKTVTPCIPHVSPQKEHQALRKAVRLLPKTPRITQRIFFFNSGLGTEVKFSFSSFLKQAGELKNTHTIALGEAVVGPLHPGPSPQQAGRGKRVGGAHWEEWSGP